MNITANLNPDTGNARLTMTILNSTSMLDIDDAHTLGDDLASCLLHDTVDDIHRDTYSVVFNATGVDVRCTRGTFAIGWRHIAHVSEQLNAF